MEEDRMKYEIERIKQNLKYTKMADKITNAPQIPFNYILDMNILLDIIEKQQKELEQEKEKNKELENADLTTVYLSGFYDGEKKWKDKIKEKIEELEKEQKEYKNSQEWEIQDDIVAQINILKELLGKNNE